jgi:hypothetical protein
MQAKKIKQGGRAKGTPNKTTSQMKEIISDVIENGLLPRIHEDLTCLSPSERVKLLATLTRYYLPYKTAIETDQLEKIQIIIDDRI